MTTERNENVIGSLIGTYVWHDSDHKWSGIAGIGFEMPEEGIRSADDGPLTPHEDVAAWLASWGGKREKEPPR